MKNNGNGIPQKVLDKFFRPFFTTKPTCQGTGLGLSLSYDIVKAHGGKIKVETKEGESAEFTIYPPCMRKRKSQMPRLLNTFRDFSNRFVFQQCLSSTGLFKQFAPPSK